MATIHLQRDAKTCKQFYLLPIASILILSFVSKSACGASSTLKDDTKRPFNTQTPTTEDFKPSTSLREQPLKFTAPLPTIFFPTKENHETTKAYSVTKSPVVVRNFTTEAYASTKGLAKEGRRRKLNVTSSTAGTGSRAPARLRDRPGAIDCDLPVLPRESRLWRGNETHEMNLPVMECASGGGGGGGEQCPPVIVSWEGSADIQSGDILIVRIGDSSLLDTFGRFDANNSSLDLNVTRAEAARSREPLFQPAVYQVTRQGHEHCDTSDGMLLDITPLDERGAKLFTLYDKDLTDGVNLLIVVSENWGSQCVRLKVTVKIDNCGEAQDCSGKGVCYTNVTMEGYECQCCGGHVGAHCDERAACEPSPCLNEGICIELAKPFNGVNYRCLCPSGFTGFKCEKDPCYWAPCLNGGTCMSTSVNGSATFQCACAGGWAGAHCERPAAGGACAPRPCLKGICVEQTDVDEDGPKYRCFCEPGYTGERCEVEYNECESSPCGGGGTCTDRVGGFECACGRGYTGATCQLKVDLCSPDPCPSQRFCVDHGNSYSCDCPRGYVGEECHIPATSACDNNPCAHGGTCWSGVDSFYCSCRPGYTGKLCEEDFILESVMDGEGETGEASEGSSVREIRLPLGLYHDRLHNVYIAAGTLGAAVLIVGVVVSACHCRVHKTYSRLLARLSRAAAPGAPPHWLLDKRAPPPAPPAALDTTDMYYTLDFSDSQSSPLIQ